MGLTAIGRLDGGVHIGGFTAFPGLVCAERVCGALDAFVPQMADHAVAQLIGPHLLGVRQLLQRVTAKSERRFAARHPMSALLPRADMQSRAGPNNDLHGTLMHRRRSLRTAST